jgi:MerR family transcriptional regulator, repressor of the yfmOP operon
MTLPQARHQLSGDGVDGTADDLVRIEQVAARTGLTKRTLRYYEEIGLLDPPTRTEGGYRLYSESDVQRLERIKRMRDLLGFSLAEIREFARIEEEREHVRSAYKQVTDPAARLARLDEAEALVRRQLGIVEEKLQGLLDMRDNLTARLDHYATLREDLQQQTNQHS